MEKLRQEQPEQYYWLLAKVKAELILDEFPEEFDGSEPLDELDWPENLPENQ